MESANPTTLTKPEGLPRVLYIGPIGLFLAATAYGMLEVHGATDTWIGLAAGRQILTADEFPTTDTFSYTFRGEVWHNQNWLTHLCQYWLYSRISPNAVVYVTWTLSASIFTLVLLAGYWRSGTWLGALLAASVVGLGCRDFLSLRPATTGFFCLAVLWALLCALEGQRDKRRWWPILLFLPLLFVWGNAHGSFVFGYGMLGLYVGHWFVVRAIRTRRSWLFTLLFVLLVTLIWGVLYSVVPPDAKTRPSVIWTLGSAAYYKKRLVVLGGILVAYGLYWSCIRIFRPRLAISDRQVAAIVGVVAAALALTVALSPFGIDNFTHGQRVAGSVMWRLVNEWLPPYRSLRNFPPVWRFWMILAVSLGVLLTCGLLRWFRRRAAPPTSVRDRLHSSLFDAAVVVIGLSMTFWARRFAPIYFILGAPVFLTWIVLLLRPLQPRLRRHLRLGVTVGAGLFAIAVGVATGTKAHGELVRAYQHHPQFNLLERVTCYYSTPHDALLFLKKNELNVNLLTEWSQAGQVMLHAPSVKIFVDGRAQQLYDETHCRKHDSLLLAPHTTRTLMMRLLDETNTDGVLLRHRKCTNNLRAALDESRDWIPVLLDASYSLFLRKGSRGLTQLGGLLRRGAEWRPDSPLALAGRGFVWQAMTSPDLPQAIACWQAALREDVTLGSLCFRPVTKALLELGREREARRFVETYYRRLDQPFTRLPDQLRRDLLEVLSQCRRDIEAAAATGQTGNTTDQVEIP